MTARFSAIRAAILVATLIAPPIAAQTKSPLPAPERSIRRDIPITNSIRRAFAAGTRDSTGRPGRNYWQMWTDYKIEARLDVPTSTVSGHETVAIRNGSDSTLQTIVVRLDQNLFAANVPRSETVGEITGGMHITRLLLNGQQISLGDTARPAIPGRTRRGPSIAEAIKGTSIRFALPTPIPPKGTGTMEVEWSFRVPLYAEGERGDRLGRWGDSLYQVAQWYPRIAVFDDLRGWDTQPYLNGSEFYNNFGHFDVSLDVPAGWIVGATGVLQNPDHVLTISERERLSAVLKTDSVQRIVGPNERGPGKSTASGDRLVWRFVADSVGDFAWGTSNQFVWDAIKANVPGKSPVPVHILYLPGHTAKYATAPALASHAVEFYSKLWMPYSFQQITVVDGPELGMEYPMFIMSSASSADHEVGHQWWPMTVGVNETWYPFMDEGFNEYMNLLSRADRERKPPALDGLGQSFGTRSGDEDLAPMMWNANYGGPQYLIQAYKKAPMMLSMLGGIVGDSAVWSAMSEYAKAWRFKHPSPWDYAFLMNNALHRDLGWFWYYWLFTNESVDGSIRQVTTSGSRTTVTVRQDGQMPSPVILSVQFAPSGPAIRPMPNSRMTDSVTAVVTYPVDVWFSGSKMFKAELNFGRRKIERITLDPQRRFPDRNPNDNVWPGQAAKK